MAIEIDNFFPDRYRYFHVPVWDEPDVNIMDFFGKCANRYFTPPPPLSLSSASSSPTTTTTLPQASPRNPQRAPHSCLFPDPDSLVSDYDQCELPHALTENSRLAKVVAGSLW